ncbi:synaptobrevin [Rhizoclosmatium globosum]|uniref:Synaptobrevin n=1 Tax=Rhizoclosmatium globosum TaxID=329046 RepID=A0A1Y2CJY5_9FUNG|nr:synaptobrevin [Rhizoclosmatium globosum]|eukprot:ORY47329.1 synaptobrevin [Rhizoclosmatium globosum]
MQDNINKVVQRGENLEALQNKTENLASSSLQFKKGATEVRKAMWWRDMKTNLILGGIVAVIIIIIIVAVVMTQQK